MPTLEPVVLHSSLSVHCEEPLVSVMLYCCVWSCKTKAAWLSFQRSDALTAKVYLVPCCRDSLCVVFGRRLKTSAQVATRRCSRRERRQKGVIGEGQREERG